MPNRAAAGAPRALEIDISLDRQDTGNDANTMILYDIPQHKYDGQVIENGSTLSSLKCLSSRPNKSLEKIKINDQGCKAAPWRVEIRGRAYLSPQICDGQRVSNKQQAIAKWIAPL